jgi:hypothetical protein
MALKTDKIGLGTTGHYIGTSGDRHKIEERTSINDYDYHDREGRLEYQLYNDTTPFALEQMLHAPSTVGSTIGGENPTNSDSFGWDVDICNGFAVVGAPGNTYSSTGSAKAGGAYLFDLRENAGNSTNCIRYYQDPTKDSNDRFYGRAVACGFGKVAIAGGLGLNASGEGQQYIDIWSTMSKLDYYSATNQQVSNLDYHRISQPVTLRCRTNTAGSTTVSYTYVDYKIYNWASGMAIADNALYVTADAVQLPLTSGNTPQEGDHFYTMLLVYSLESGQLVNYSVADFRRPNTHDYSSTYSLKSDLPPLSGGNYNDTGVTAGAVVSGTFDYTTYNSPQSYGDSIFAIPNNRIAIGSDRVVVGAPLWSPNTDLFGGDWGQAIGNAYVFDMSGNYMYELFDETEPYNYCGATVAAGMNVIGASGARYPQWQENDESDRLEFLFFHADTNYRHIIMPYIGEQGDDYSTTSYRSAGRVMMGFVYSTATYKELSGATAGLLLAGGVRMCVTQTDDVPKVNIGIMDEDFFPYLNGSNSDPNGAITRILNTSFWPSNSYTTQLDRFTLGKMKYSNGKMISSANLYTVLPDKKVAIYKWPNRTHSKDMMEHLR